MKGVAIFVTAAISLAVALALVGTGEPKQCETVEGMTLTGPNANFIDDGATGTSSDEVNENEKDDFEKKLYLISKSLRSIAEDFASLLKVPAAKKNENDSDSPSNTEMDPTDYLYATEKNVRQALKQMFVIVDHSDIFAPVAPLLRKYLEVAETFLRAAWRR